jgi:8-oxo-dGTP pyrophosphatase MutT (NUDIX family)
MVDDDDRVALIRKARPPWQAGLLNGVGGKIEPEDWSPFFVHDMPAPEPVALRAMRREFREETGVDFDRWEPMVRLVAVSTEDRAGSITEEPGVVWFMRAQVDARTLDRVRTCTDEEVEVHLVRNLIGPASNDVQVRRFRSVPNLRWLLPLAAHRADTYRPFEVVETSTTLRSPTV